MDTMRVTKADQGEHLLAGTAVTTSDASGRDTSGNQAAMRVLISTWPAHGHLLPMLPLARAAQRAGHEVVVASGAEGVAEARRRAVKLVPRAREWKPDLVVHPVTELAGAIAAAHTGARHVVHGLGPIPAEAWAWFGARFGELCREWDVPELADGILETTYLDNCPPSLQSDAVADFRRRRPLRPSPGEAQPGERLPWDDDTLAALPYEQHGPPHPRDALPRCDACVRDRAGRTAPPAGQRAGHRGAGH